MKKTKVFLIMLAIIFSGVISFNNVRSNIKSNAKIKTYNCKTKSGYFNKKCISKIASPLNKKLGSYYIKKGSTIYIPIEIFLKSKVGNKKTKTTTAKIKIKTKNANGYTAINTKTKKVKVSPFNQKKAGKIAYIKINAPKKDRNRASIVRIIAGSKNIWINFWIDKPKSIKSFQTNIPSRLNNKKKYFIYLSYIKKMYTFKNKSKVKLSIQITPKISGIKLDKAGVLRVNTAYKGIVSITPILDGIKGEPVTVNINSISTMQGFRRIDCNNLKTYQSITLKDVRNNQNYTIRKMPDYTCYMVNNLRLGSTTSTTILNNKTSNINTPTYILPRVMSTGKSTNTDPQIFGPIPGYSNTNHTSKYFGGYLYNYKAITQDSSSFPNGDICPTGWTFSADYFSLNSSFYFYKNKDSNSSAPWIATDKWAGVFAGYYNSKFINQNTNGYYWSTDDIEAYSSLEFSSTKVNTTRNSSPEFAFAVRCHISI